MTVPDHDDVSKTPPRWQQIATALARSLEAERLAPGARLPTEAQLAERFGANRHTIRRALEVLVRAGQIRTERGRGAFIADDLLDYEIAARTRFSERIRRHNRVPDGRVLRIRDVAASPAVADALDLAPGARVVMLERIGLADGVPVSLTDHYFPADRLPGIAAALRANATITDALRAAGIADYVRQFTRVTARLPSAAEADHLEMPRARPLLICENLNVDQRSIPVEFGLSRHPSNRLQLVFEP